MPSRTGLTKVLGELRSYLEANYAKELASKVYLVCDELLKNSLEHGCYGIGASKKAELLEKGEFEDYIISSEKLHANLDNCWIEVEMHLTGNQIVLKVRDSGLGYELEESSKEKSLDLARLSQRGLELAQSLSSGLMVEKKPTQTTATFLLS